MNQIVLALLSMNGRITMLGMSRWTGEGGSYRTIQRWFATKIAWPQVFWQFFRHHLYKAGESYVLFGDEVVVPKSGKSSHGIDRFYSGLFEQVIPSLSFFTLGIGSVGEKRSFPVQVEQIVRSAEEKAASKAKAQEKAAKKKPPASKGKAGRPKGSKNKGKAVVIFTPELLRIQAMVQAQLRLTNGLIALHHLIMDGHFGNNPALQMVLLCQLHLISKLRSDSALFFRKQDEYSGTGKPRKYGDKVNYRAIPDKYRKEERLDADYKTQTYQATLLHKEFSQALNVVILVKTNRKTGASAHILLFSSDLLLAYDKIIDFYCLRFQLEFNFRDAKQFWGLDDFMNTSQTAITNAANLALFMPNFTYLLLQPFRQTSPDFSVLDLKSYHHAYKYLIEIIKFLPDFPNGISIQSIFHNIADIGSIHPIHSTPIP